MVKMIQNMEIISYILVDIILNSVIVQYEIIY